MKKNLLVILKRNYIYIYIYIYTYMSYLLAFNINDLNLIWKWLLNSLIKNKINKLTKKGAIKNRQENTKSKFIKVI